MKKQKAIIITVLILGLITILISSYQRHNSKEEREERSAVKEQEEVVKLKEFKRVLTQINKANKENKKEVETPKEKGFYVISDEKWKEILAKDEARIERERAKYGKITQEEIDQTTREMEAIKETERKKLEKLDKVAVAQMCDPDSLLEVFHATEGSFVHPPKCMNGKRRIIHLLSPEELGGKDKKITIFDAKRTLEDRGCALADWTLIAAFQRKEPELFHYWIPIALESDRPLCIESEDSSPALLYCSGKLTEKHRLLAVCK